MIIRGRDGEWVVLIDGDICYEAESREDAIEYVALTDEVIDL